MLTEMEKIEKIIRKGLFSMSEAIYQHWPHTEDNTENEISEANITIHLAHALINAGYSTFAEYRINENEHYDLKAVCPDKTHHIILESKRFLKSDETSMVYDLQRMLDEPKGDVPVYGVAACLTQNINVHDWWVDPDRGEYPKNCSSNVWKELHDFIGSKQVNCISFPLSYQTYEVECYMALYGIFEIHGQSVLEGQGS